MTLTIELTPEEEARLENLARLWGLEAAECVRQLLTAHLPPLTTHEGTDARRSASLTERDPTLVARVRSIRGKFAHTAGDTLASEQLHRERQTDKEKEERLIQGH